jgi:hypothetical protein
MVSWSDVGTPVLVVTVPAGLFFLVCSGGDVPPCSVFFAVALPPPLHWSVVDATVVEERVKPDAVVHRVLLHDAVACAVRASAAVVASVASVASPLLMRTRRRGCRASSSRAASCRHA